MLKSKSNCFAKNPAHSFRNRTGLAWNPGADTAGDAGLGVSDSGINYPGGAFPSPAAPGGLGQGQSRGYPQQVLIAVPPRRLFSGSRHSEKALPGGAG